LKIPRNIRGYELVKTLALLGYVTVRQTGSSIRIKTERNVSMQKLFPITTPIKIGTFNKILSNIAEYFKINKEKLINKLF